MKADVQRASVTLQAQGFASIETIVALTRSGTLPAEGMTQIVAVPYAEMTGFIDTSPAGRLVSGVFEGQRVVLLDGVQILDDPRDAASFRLPFEVLADIGARIFVAVCPVVSLQGDIYPGSLVIVTDHVSLNGTNPFAGLAGDHRFGSMKDCYDARLRRRLKAAAAASGVAAHEGVHFSVAGPWPETVAEARLGKLVNADVLGAGLAEQALVARWLGLRVAAIAVVTGFAAGIGPATTQNSGKDVTMAASIGLRRLLRAFFKPADD